MLRSMERAPAGLAETSTEFGTDEVGPFLARVAPLVEEGFGESEIARVVEVAEALEVEEEATLRFEVICQGEQIPLLIHLFIDDFDLAAVHFFSAPLLIEAIEKEIESALGFES
jgi:hypothetical protein